MRFVILLFGLTVGCAMLAAVVLILATGVPLVGAVAVGGTGILILTATGTKLVNPVYGFILPRFGGQSTLLIMATGTAAVSVLFMWRVYSDDHAIYLLVLTYLVGTSLLGQSFVLFVSWYVHIRESSDERSDDEAS